MAVATAYKKKNTNTNSHQHKQFVSSLLRKQKIHTQPK